MFTIGPTAEHLWVCVGVADALDINNDVLISGEPVGEMGERLWCVPLHRTLQEVIKRLKVGFLSHIEKLVSKYINVLWEYAVAKTCTINEAEDNF